MQGDADTASSLDRRLGDMERRLAHIEASARSIEDTVRDTRRLVGPFAASLADGKLLVHTTYSTLLIVDSSDLIITPQLVIYRRWEPELTELIWNSCHTDTVFVDVGANIGYFTVLAGSRIRDGGKGRVIAVEPNPACLPLLERNLVINWSMCPIEVHKVAAGAAPGEAWLASPASRAANAHISAAGEDAEIEQRTAIRVETLDSLVPESLAVDILKIDVEGHEISVFRGAERIIARSPDIKIVMEWSPGQIAAAGVSVAEIQANLRRLGLVARRLPRGGSLHQLTLENSPLIPIDRLSDLAYDNILLTRQA
jgi:FkbM family methyltransferase